MRGSPGRTKTKWEEFTSREDEAAATPSRVELDLLSTPERGGGGGGGAGAGAGAVAGAGGSAFLSDAKRLFRGMSVAMRSGLTVTLPWAPTAQHKHRPPMRAIEDLRFLVRFNINVMIL